MCVCVCQTTRSTVPLGKRMAAQMAKNLLYIAIFSVKKIQFNHCEHDFTSTKLSLRIEKLILTFSTPQLVLSNNFDYSNAFDTFLTPFFLYSYLVFMGFVLV